MFSCLCLCTIATGAAVAVADFTWMKNETNENRKGSLNHEEWNRDGKDSRKGLLYLFVLYLW